MSTRVSTTTRAMDAGAMVASARATLRQMGKNHWSYVFLVPMVALVGLFVIYPLVASIGITMYDWNGIGSPTRWVGLRHFFTVARDAIFWTAFRNTFVYTLVLVPIQLTIALIMALVLNNPRLKGSSIYRAVYFSPVVTSAAMVGIVVSLLLGTVGGQVSDFLIRLGVIDTPVDFLGSPQFALAAVIAVGIWHTMGYNMVYFLAALQSIPKEMYEAARVDGANAIQQFLKITVPMLREVGMVILFLAILGSLQVFDLVLVMTGGGPYFKSEVVSTYIYHFAFSSASAQSESNVGYASAAALFMGVMVMAITALQLLTVHWARRRRADVQ